MVENGKMLNVEPRFNWICCDNNRTMRPQINLARNGGLSNPVSVISRCAKCNLSDRRREIGNAAMRTASRKQCKRKLNSWRNDVDEVSLGELDCIFGWLESPPERRDKRNFAIRAKFIREKSEGESKMKVAGCEGKDARYQSVVDFVLGKSRLTRAADEILSKFYASPSIHERRANVY